MSTYCFQNSNKNFMDFTTVDINLFANYTPASSFTSCLHTEENSLILRGLFTIYTITVGKLTFLKSVALHESTTKIKEVYEPISFSLNKAFKCSHIGVRYPAISFAFFDIKKKRKEQKKPKSKPTLRKV